MNTIFIAPPAAGKGTQAKFLSEEFNIPHISTGDLLREEVNLGTELGDKIKNNLDKGEFVTDDIITELLTSRLTKPDCDYGCILDGYPRNITQAKLLEDIFDKLDKELDNVLFLDIDLDLALKRMQGRIVCPKCGTSYNINNESLKPKKDGICDKCATELEKRNDDNEETFKNRFNVYLDKTSELLDYYDKLGLLKKIEINNSDSAADTYLKIKKVINSD